MMENLVYKSFESEKSTNMGVGRIELPIFGLEPKGLPLAYTPY
jgi:hypothetical protein